MLPLRASIDNLFKLSLAILATRQAASGTTNDLTSDPTSAQIVIQRFFQILTTTLLTALMLGLLASAAQATEGIEIPRAHLELTDGGYALSANFAFELNRGLEEALTEGLPLHFTTTIELTRPRWYWLDENTVDASQSVRISYNVLTRQYRVAINNGLQQNFSTLDEALALIRRPTRWIVAKRGKLKRGETYHCVLQLKLDLTQLPKPFQVNAINNSEWRFSSDKKHFLYQAE